MKRKYIWLTLFAVLVGLLSGCGQPERKNASGDDTSIFASSPVSSGEEAGQSGSKVQQETNPASEKITVTLSVDCKTAVEEGYETAIVLADDGILLSGKPIVLEKDASVYDALRQSGLVVGANSSALGTYVYSIQSLGEKMCGAGSGWKYSVNGSYPGESCSSYLLSNGDVVSWRYTCDHGKDL